MEHVCGYEACVKPSKYNPLLWCSGCRAVMYCDAGCQKGDWKGHKVACRAAQEELSRTQLVAVGRVRDRGEGPEVARDRAAAARGDARCQYSMGCRYAKGEGVPQDYAQAFGWWMKSALQGDAAAQHKVGICFFQGEGVPQDYAQAFGW